jgi:hypothetical protein
MGQRKVCDDLDQRVFLRLGKQEDLPQKKWHGHHLENGNMGLTEGQY